MDASNPAGAAALKVLAALQSGGAWDSAIAAGGHGLAIRSMGSPVAAVADPFPAPPQLRRQRSTPAEQMEHWSQDVRALVEAGRVPSRVAAGLQGVLDWLGTVDAETRQAVGKRAHAALTDAAEERRTCLVCYEDFCVSQGISCDSAEAHFVHDGCFGQFVAERSDTEQHLDQLRELKGQLACLVPGCSAPPYEDALVARHAPDESSRRYFRVRADVVGSLARQQALAEAEKMHSETRALDLLRAQLKERFPNAFMCGRCSFGPVDHMACSDLVAHNGQVLALNSRINNACPRCGWFVTQISQWPRWDGRLPEESAGQPYPDVEFDPFAVMMPQPHVPGVPPPQPPRPPPPPPQPPQQVPQPPHHPVGRMRMPLMPRPPQSDRDDPFAALEPPARASSNDDPWGFTDPAVNATPVPTPVVPPFTRASSTEGAWGFMDPAVIAAPIPLPAAAPAPVVDRREGLLAGLGLDNAAPPRPGARAPRAAAPPAPVWRRPSREANSARASAPQSQATPVPAAAPAAAPAPAQAQAQAPAPAQVQARERWSCGFCTLDNPMTLTNCELCERPRSGAPPPLPSDMSARQTMTLEEVLGARASGLDVTRLEQYLSDEAFEGALGVPREAFLRMAPLRQQALKQAAGLLLPM